jgi:hypothetical protein
MKSSLSQKRDSIVKSIDKLASSIASDEANKCCIGINLSYALDAVAAADACR